MPGAGAQNGKGGPKVTRLCIKTVANVCREGGTETNRQPQSPTQVEQDRGEPPPSALNMTLPAFAAECRRLQKGARSYRLIYAASE